MNILYVVPDLEKVSGGPRTRISMFKHVFIKNDGIIIEKGNKLQRSLKPRKINLVYVESATNRIGLIDIICLFVLKLYSKKVIVFIRDVYMEFFPEEYTSFRNRITLVVNKASNFYLSLIAISMVFPTKEMGAFFFQKNRFFPKRKYTDLPPGTLIETNKNRLPDFSKKIGILYLGGTRYANSGFQAFIDFAQKKQNTYNFFVLSGDGELKENLLELPINLDNIERAKIPVYIQQHNITYAIHTRPINGYDYMTFPIKVLDFINFRLPFFSEKHLPLKNLFGEEYDLFLPMKDLNGIHDKIQSIGKNEYKGYLHLFKDVSKRNTYDERYKKLLNQ